MTKTIDCPSQLNWKKWKPGHQYPMNLIVKNISNSTKKFIYRLPESGLFYLSFPEWVSLSPGMTYCFEVIFRPIVESECSEKLFFDFVDEEKSFSVDLIASIPVSSAELDRNLDFGVCPVHQSSTKAVTLRNTGDIAFKFEFNYQEPFSISPPTGMLKPTESQIITVSFTPKKAMQVSAEIICSANTFAHKLHVTAISKFAFISVSDSKIDFGDSFVSQNSEKTVTIRNQSAVPAKIHSQLTIHSFTESDQSNIVTQLGRQIFSFSPHNFVVAPGSSQIINIKYSPIAVGLFSSCSIIFSASSANSVTLNCRGSCISPLVTISKSTLAFESIEVNTCCKKSFSLKNSSNIPIKFTFLTDTDGSFRLDFFSGIIDPRASKTITVSFKPHSPINYYKRLFCLIENAPPVFLDLIGTGYDSMIRPAMLSPAHVKAYLEKVAEPKVNENVHDVLLHQELGMAVNEVFIDKSLVVFKGAIQQNAHYSNVVVSNHNSVKITCVWDLPYDGVFSVLPNSQDIMPNSTVSFRVCFKPDKINFFYSSRLECYCFLKTNRVFRLVDHSTFTPPWCLSIDVVGDSSISGTQQFVPRCELVPLHANSSNVLRFPPCLPMHTSFQSFLLQNHSDTPLLYEMTPDVSPDGIFRLCHSAGVINPHAFSIIVVAFLPDSSVVPGANQRFEVACVFNNTQPPTPLIFSAIVDTPKLVIEKSKLFFKPTALGSSSNRILIARNVSFVPLHYKWESLKQITIQPAQGFIRANEDIDFNFTLTPSILGRIKEHVLVSYSDKTESVTIIGESRVGSLTMSATRSPLEQPTGKPESSFDMGHLMINDSFHSVSIIISNSEHIALDYSLEYFFIDNDGSPLVDSPVIVKIDSVEGNVLARSSNRFGLQFQSQQPCFFSCILLCYTSQHKNPISSILIQGSFEVPLIKISRALFTGGSPFVAWNQFSISSINASFAFDGSSFEMSRHSVEFGIHEFNSKPRVLILELSNIGMIDLFWKLSLPDAIEMNSETWDCDIPTEEEAAQTNVMDARVFKFSSYNGVLKKGASFPLAITYSPVFVGHHDLPVVFSITNGQSVLLQIHGETFDKFTPRVSLPSTTNNLIPIPYGVEFAPWQLIPLKNHSNIVIQYSVDLIPFFELAKKNFGFKVLEISNPIGSIPPMGTKFLAIRGCPISTSPDHGFALDTTIQLSCYNKLSFLPFSLFLPVVSPQSDSPFEELLSLWPIATLCQFPVDYHLDSPDSFIKISSGGLWNLGNVAFNSVSRHLVRINNLSEIHPCEFNWQELIDIFDPDDLDEQKSYEYKSHGSVSIIPCSGIIPPRESISCEVLFRAGSEFILFDRDIRCICKLLSEPVINEKEGPISIEKPCISLKSGSLTNISKETPRKKVEKSIQEKLPTDQPKFIPESQTLFMHILAATVLPRFVDESQYVQPVSHDYEPATGEDATQACAHVLTEVMKEIVSSQCIQNVISSPGPGPPSYYALQNQNRIENHNFKLPISEDLPPSPESDAALLATFSKIFVDILEESIFSAQ